MKNSSSPLFDYHDSGATKRKYGRTTHGGADSKGRRKEYRPLSEKKWIHLTLKSSKAKGPWSFLTPKNQQIIREILKSKSKKWGVQIAEIVNVGNHLHIKLKFKYREGFQNFLRSVTALIARKITNARRGHAAGKFWQGLAFTRVIQTKLEELQLRGYFKANRLQATKGQNAREEYLQKFNEWVFRLRAGPLPVSSA
ncbi:MAG: transposase [Bdellovibrionales bacterium]|nr:transposase [Bdellovibrionales bacterium]